MTLRDLINKINNLKDQIFRTNIPTARANPVPTPTYPVNYTNPKTGSNIFSNVPPPNYVGALPSAWPSFGEGNEVAYIEPTLYDTLLGSSMSAQERANIAELSGQESRYGYAGPNITEREQSYGPYHINLMAGRISPRTSKPFTLEEAKDVAIATEHALSEYRRTGGLGRWNPGAFNWYQYGLPKQAKTKKYMRGK